MLSRILSTLSIALVTSSLAGCDGHLIVSRDRTMKGDYETGHFIVERDATVTVKGNLFVQAAGNIRIDGDIVALGADSDGASITLEPLYGTLEINGTIHAGHGRSTPSRWRYGQSASQDGGRGGDVILVNRRDGIIINGNVFAGGGGSSGNARALIDELHPVGSALSGTGGDGGSVIIRTGDSLYAQGRIVAGDGGNSGPATVDAGGSIKLRLQLVSRRGLQPEQEVELEELKGGLLAEQLIGANARSQIGGTGGDVRIEAANAFLYATKLSAGRGGDTGPARSYFGYSSIAEAGSPGNAGSIHIDAFVPPGLTPRRVDLRRGGEAGYVEAFGLIIAEGKAHAGGKAGELLYSGRVAHTGRAGRSLWVELVSLQPRNIKLIATRTANGATPGALAEAKLP